MQWMILPFKRYFDFQGRSRRMEFWMFTLLNLIIVFVFAALSLGTGTPLGQMQDADPNNVTAFYGALFGGTGILLVVWWLIAFIPSIAVAVRRFHDRDMTGWWYLGFMVLSLIPFIGFLAAIAFIVVMALPGTPGPNRFGPSPKEEVTAETFE